MAVGETVAVEDAFVCFHMYNTHSLTSHRIERNQARLRTYEPLFPAKSNLITNNQKAENTILLPWVVVPWMKDLQ